MCIITISISGYSKPLINYFIGIHIYLVLVLIDIYIIIYNYYKNKRKIKILRPILQFLFQNNILILFKLSFNLYWDEKYWDEKKLNMLKRYYRNLYFNSKESKTNTKKEKELQEKYFEIAFNDAIQISKRIYLRLENLNKENINCFYKNYLKFIGKKYKKDENLKREYIEFKDQMDIKIIKLLNLIY